METDLVNYIERLELMAFFAGYPLIYSIVKVISGYQLKTHPLFAGRMVQLLSSAYALVATLFIGLLLRDLYASYASGNNTLIFPFSFLKAWGCLAICCWLPWVASRPVLSLCHSLVFFILLLKDIFSKNVAAPEIIRNDMKIYTDSLLLNIICYLLVLIFYVAVNRFIKKNDHSIN